MCRYKTPSMLLLVISTNKSSVKIVDTYKFKTSHKAHISTPSNRFAECYLTDDI